MDKEGQTMDVVCGKDHEVKQSGTEQRENKEPGGEEDAEGV